LNVAVVTPYYRANRTWLEDCHRSVLAQTHACTHILVADGPAEPAVRSFEAQHIVLSATHADFGDTPRAIGSISAARQGFDAIAYLDADNWYEPDHIESLVGLHLASGASVCTSGRMLYRLDGSVLGECPDVDGRRFVDTNCLFITRAAYSLVTVWWTMHPDLHAVDDRVLWHAVRRRGLSHAHTGRPTVAYRTGFAHHYHRAGEIPPAGSKTGKSTAASLKRFFMMLREQRPRTAEGRTESGQLDSDVTGPDGSGEDPEGPAGGAVGGAPPVWVPPG